MKYSALLYILLFILLIGCAYQLPQEENQQVSPVSSKELICPDGEKVITAYECKNFNHSFSIRNHLNCSDPTNFKKTGVDILNPTEPPRDVPYYHSGYIRTKWYPSLNEGNIELLSQYLENTGCTVINNSRIGVTYVVTDKQNPSNRRVAIFPSGELFYISGKDTIYPGDFDLFKIVFFEEFNSHKTDLAKFPSQGPYTITTIIDYKDEVVLKDEFTISIE